MEWYRKTQSEVEDFFLVSAVQGLDEKEALLRLSKLGKNSEPELRTEVASLLQITVIRNGQKQKISTQNLVNGDVVVLEKGDRVPADLRLIEVQNLYIDQSFFTNEGLPAQKNTLPLLQATELRKQRCMAFMGSFVTQGYGKGIVVGRNDQTELVRDAAFFKQRVKRSLQKEIKRMHDLRIVVNHPQKVTSLLLSGIVIFEIHTTNESILSLIRHLQMIQGIETKFILPKKQALHLSELLGGEVAELEDHIDFEKCKNAHFFFSDKKEPWLSRLGLLYSDMRKNILLIGDGREVVSSHDQKIVTMLFGMNLSGQAICSADFISPRESPLILKSILYNKIKHKALDKIKK